MTDLRKRYDGTFKAKVVLESLKNQKTIAELASEYGIHPNQITQWRKQGLEKLPGIFSSKCKDKGDWLYYRPSDEDVITMKNHVRDSYSDIPMVMQLPEDVQEV